MTANIPKGPTPELKAKINAYAGTRAVHRGSGILAPVTIDRIIWTESIGAEHSQLIFAARLGAIDGIVLTCLDFEPVQSSFEVSAGWDYLTVEPDAWDFGGYGASWKVTLSEKACDAIIQFYRENLGLDKKDRFHEADGLLARYGI